MDFEQRLQRDARRVAGDPEVAAFHQCLGEHLFDPALDAGFMARVCGAPRPVRDRLAAKVGPLKGYVTELRMAEAARRVRETSESVAEIGKGVGYLVVRTFRRAFLKAHGVLPNEMRRRAREGGAGAEAAERQGQDAAGAALSAAEDAGSSAGAEPKIEDDEPLSPRGLASRIRLRRCLGLLDPRRAAELRLRLRRRHPGLDETEAAPPSAGPRQAAPPDTEPPPTGESPRGEEHPVLLTPTGDWLEEITSASAYGEILDLPEEDQRFALLDGLRLGNVAAFYQLFRFCRELVQWNDERASSLARLAVELVEPHREIMGEEGDAWKALAWVLLGEVQALAGDSGDADQALAFAVSEAGDEDALPPWVEIELRRVEGMIRQRQRRHGEAVRARDRAVELGRALETHHPSRRQTVFERLELASTLGDAEAGFALIQELEELLDATFGDGDRPTSWQGRILLHGARAHAAAGSDCCAERCLRQAMKDITADPRCDTAPRLGILFTFVIHELARVLSRGDRLEDCESMLRHSVERYRWLEIPVLEATAEAELAAVCALRGRRAEARQLAASAADFLDDLPPLHREAWQAARRLRTLANGGTAATEGELKELLADLQRQLDLASWEITGAQARPAVLARRAKDGAATVSTPPGPGT